MPPVRQFWLAISGRMRRQLTKMKKGTAMRERRFGRSTVWTVIALGLSAVGAVAPAIAAPILCQIGQGRQRLPAEPLWQAILHQGGWW